MINQYNKIKLFFLKKNIKPYQSFNRNYCSNLITDDLLNKNKSKLEPYHKFYIENISSPDMAASLELATFIYTLCEVKKAAKVLDVGSGFSSFIFRLYASHTPGVTVFSIDDDALWLEKTKDYLKKENLNTDNMYTVDEFFKSNIADFDIILHDMNYVDVRIKYVEKVMNIAKSGGVVIMDDVHKPDYMLPLLNLLKIQDVSVYDLKPVTFDSFKRFALAVIKS